MIGDQLIERNESGHFPRMLEPVPSPAAADGARREPAAPWHILPRTVAETGLDISLLLSLLMKVAYLHRSATLVMLMDTLKLPAMVINEVAAYAVRERLLEVAHRGANDLDVRYQLTDAGYIRAAEFTARCSYVGAAPVTLEAYVEAVQRHSIQRTAVSKEEVSTVFSTFVMPEDLLDDVGVALNTSRALMLYGPAGGGKTYLAQHLGMLLPGVVPVPYAVTVAGDIIQIFDPLVHVVQDDGEGAVARRPLDRRWQMCHRPAVLSGGELTLDMLELRYDSATGFYQAPPHMKANNGIYIVDDLGRQQVGVSELLNRWIVPLDRRVDMFSLRNGVRFSVPFDVWPVFSTNLEPAQLGDDAFLRRLGSKLYVGPLSVDDYREIYLRAAQELGLQNAAAAFDYLCEALHGASGKPLLACIPRDLLRLVASSVTYRGAPPEVSEEALRRAWQIYFCSHADFGKTDSMGAGTGWRQDVQART
ncbi:MAG: ATP-binding protein [Burkholderiaceae bacterium]|nr:ATP-binding protein [Burkholderiaceae bacterium]